MMRFKVTKKNLQKNRVPSRHVLSLMYTFCARLPDVCVLSQRCEGERARTACYRGSNNHQNNLIHHV